MICPIYQNLFAIGMPVEKNRSRSLCFEIEWCYTFCQQVIGDATLKSGIIEHAVSVETWPNTRNFAFLTGISITIDWSLIEKINKQLATSIYIRNSNSQLHPTHFPKTPFCVINEAKGSFYVLLHLLLSFSMVHVANSSWPCVNEHGFFRHGLLDRVEEAPLSWYTVEYTNAF